MSALTDLFTSLANKIRTKLSTSTTYTPAQAVAAIDDVYDKGVTDTKVGNAGAGDVLSGKTFTNSSTVGETGTMTNNGAVSQSLNCGGSYTVPAGYHNGSGKVTANSLASQTGVDSGKTAVTAGTMVSGYQGWVNGNKVTGTFAGQEKTVTAETSAASVTPDSGKYLTKVTYNPTPSQTKSASPSTSAQTISPDSGKLLSSVSISAISPQRAAGVAATTSGLLNSSNLTGYVYFPYGWHPNTNSTYGNYCSVTQSQAQACHYHTGTATVSTRGASVDIGQLHSYRYVNTNSVPNSNSGTYTPSSNGTALDMGATNTYRYVNTSTVYNLGLTNARNEERAVSFDIDAQSSGIVYIQVNPTCKKVYFKITYDSGSYVSGDAVKIRGTNWNTVLETKALNTTSSYSLYTYSSDVMWLCIVYVKGSARKISVLYHTAL